MESKEIQMDFLAFKHWLKARGLTFTLEGWSGCIPDTILVYKGSSLLYEGDYYSNTDYIHAAGEIEKML